MPKADMYEDYRDYYNKYDLYDYYEDDDEDCYDDPNEYIPRIEGTELEAGLAFFGFNYLPLLTSRVANGVRKFYLFDFIKVKTEHLRDCEV